MYDDFPIKISMKNPRISQSRPWMRWRILVVALSFFGDPLGWFSWKILDISWMVYVWLIYG